MKITRAQIRALEQKTRGFVDTLECELEPAPRNVNDDVVLTFHHVRVVTDPDGRYWVVNRQTEEPINDGAIDRVVHDA